MIRMDGFDLSIFQSSVYVFDTSLSVSADIKNLCSKSKACTSVSRLGGNFHVLRMACLLLFLRWEIFVLLNGIYMYIYSIITLTI